MTLVYCSMSYHLSFISMNRDKQSEAMYEWLMVPVLKIGAIC